jgi:hypothetical protein
MIVGPTVDQRICHMADPQANDISAGRNGGNEACYAAHTWKLPGVLRTARFRVTLRAHAYA